VSDNNGGSILPLSNRIARLGTGAAVLVALAMCAIVQQTIRQQMAAHQAPVASPSPATVQTTTSKPKRKAKRTAAASSVTKLESKVRTTMRTSAAAQTAFGKQTLGQPNVEVSRVDQGKGWAFGTSAVEPPSGTGVSPYPSIFLAHLTKTGWQVALTGTAQFTTLLGKAPASVVPKTEVPILQKYGAAAPATPPTATGLTLPWSAGQSWTLEQASGTTALQFGGGDGRVLAPADGRIYRLCTHATGRGLLLMLHSNGLASEYYQLTGEPKLTDGTLIKQGTFLGKIGTDRPCGDPQPSAPAALSFAVLSAAHPLPLNGLQIGGWTLHTAGSGPVSAERLGVSVSAGNPLLNFGSLATASPTPKLASPSPSGST
jgi:hypothetical protein